MKNFHIRSRSLTVLAVLVTLLLLFGYVALRSGPMAPVQVTVTQIENHAVMPSLFGIGTVEARYTYRIGPTLAGRVLRVNVDVGDKVVTGQVLGEMDPVDMQDRVAALDAAQKRAAALVTASEAQVRDAEARKIYAGTQALRYDQALQVRAVSEETRDAKEQERQVHDAGLAAALADLEAACHELERTRADLEALIKQRDNLRLIAPTNGLVVARDAEPGTTVVAVQSVVEVVSPETLWINVRFDQLRSKGLQAGLPAQIVLRSQKGHPLAGRVLRVEPLADSVTEEMLAKVVFDSVTEPLPPIGELAEVTLTLPALPSGPSLPNAAIRRIDGKLGVWQVINGALHFTPVKLGAADLDGQVQILEGLKAGDQVVVYSAKALKPHNRIEVADQIPGVAK
ncbi:MAG: efflux RND transporter periplasmic adaptor subunit [Kiritimatiellae bacterium]|nr:efflux RND transporter periplasmic adaptor subunit [Kiritimatiellia bacterium]